MSIINKLASFFNRRDKGDLKLFTEVIDDKLMTVSEDISLLELEYNLRTASGKWLDEWGSWFGVYRGMDECDDDYRYRILTSLARATGTIPAIISSVLEYYDVEYGSTQPNKYTEDDITVLEPYTLLKKFSECGDFSGIHRYPDGEFYRHHTLEISLPESVTPELREMVEKTKAAGIKVYYKVSESTRPNEDGSSGIVSTTPSCEPVLFTSLNSDLEHASIRYGNMYSKYVSMNKRSRSGRKILDTIETFIAMDSNVVTGHTYKDISEFWRIMCAFGHTTPVYIPKEEKIANIFSESLGNRSGDREGHFVNKPVEEVWKDAEDNVLQLPVVQTHSYIKPARRSRCGNGHSMGYPRSGLEGENYDIWQKEYVDSNNYHDFYWHMKDWADTTVITTIEVELEKPPTVLVDKFFVTEEVQDEVHFNVISETVRFSDAGYYGEEVPFNDVLEVDVQSSSMYVHTKTMICSEEDTILSIVSDTHIEIESIASRHRGIDEDEEIHNSANDTTVIDKTFITEEVKEGMWFNTVSETVGFDDAGNYGSEHSLDDVIDVIEVQSSIVVATLPISETE